MFLSGLEPLWRATLAGLLVLVAFQLSTVASHARAASGKRDRVAGNAAQAKSNYATANAAFVRACNAGDAEACFHLGRNHANGLGIPHDLAGALKLYEQSCNAGYGSGCNDLAFAYYRGEGVPAVDLPRAIPYWQKACDLGKTKSCYFAGRLMDPVKDSVRATALLGKACDAKDGVPETGKACGALGTNYANGRGVTQDLATGAGYFRRACDAGDMVSCDNLGIALRDGSGVAADPAAAIILFDKACTGKVVSGCLDAADAYSAGIGVTADKAKAAQFFNLACTLESSEGCYGLGVVTFKGEGVPVDFPAAIRLMEKACAGDYAEGCYVLGQAAAQGKGMAKDVVKAASLFRKALALRPEIKGPTDALAALGMKP
jgi:TPR repeat protein